jgi:hypothetical protein
MIDQPKFVSDSSKIQQIMPTYCMKKWHNFLCEENIHEEMKMFGSKICKANVVELLQKLGVPMRCFIWTASLAFNEG